MFTDMPILTQPSGGGSVVAHSLCGNIDGVYTKDFVAEKSASKLVFTMNGKWAASTSTSTQNYNYQVLKINGINQPLASSPDFDFTYPTGVNGWGIVRWDFNNIAINQGDTITLSIGGEGLGARGSFGFMIYY